MKTLLCFRNQLNTSGYDNKFVACGQNLLEIDKMFLAFSLTQPPPKKKRNQKRIHCAGQDAKFQTTDPCAEKGFEASQN